MEDFSTESVSVFTYAARIILEQGEPQEVEVILTELPFAILGRDILNEFYLYLQGPKSSLK